MSEFVNQNKQVWSELAEMTRRAARAPKSMSPLEIDRLDQLYRRTTVHLAQVTSRSRDARLARYLNDLVTAAHTVIYLPPRESMFKGAARFIAEGFPRSVIRTGRFHWTAAALMFAGAFVAYHAARIDPLAAYAILSPDESRLPGSTPAQLEAALRHGRDQGSGEKLFFASFLFNNNLKVGIMAMGLGFLAAVPTVLLLIYNGMMLGVFTAVHHQAGIVGEYWAWILPHGVTELGAIVLCGGVGLLLGKAVVSPGLATRLDSLRLAGAEAARICGGAALMLVFAAFIESFLRQSHLSTGARLLFAAGTAVFWLAYFAFGFVRERSERSFLEQPAFVDIPTPERASKAPRAPG